MFKRLLRSFGLIAAPPPVRSYIKASTFVGTLPALAYVAWRYRGRIAGALRRSPRQLRALPATNVPVASQPAY